MTEEQRRLLAHDNAILLTAFSHININVFEYTISTDILRFIDQANPPFSLPRQFGNAVSYFLDSEIVHPECKLPFRQLFEQAVQENISTSATLKTGNISNHTWHRIILTPFIGEDNTLSYIVGTIQDVSERIAAELRYSKEEQYRLAMFADSRRIYEINVTHDKFMKLESINDSTDSENWKPYTQEMNNLRKTLVFKKDWKVFLETANRENLLQAFRSGNTELYCEYRTLMPDGTMTWSSSTTHLLQDPFSGDIKGFTYADDITAQKEQEFLLRRQAERDPLTGLYNRITAEQLITGNLLQFPSESVHGFLSIDVDGFKQVNDTYGHLCGDTFLKELSCQLLKNLRKDDILSRTGGDEFIVFLRNTSSIAYVEKVTRRLINCTRHVSVVKDSCLHISISVGIAMFPKNGTTFLDLYAKSDKALYTAKQQGKNRYVMYLPEDGYTGETL